MTNDNIDKPRIPRALSYPVSLTASAGLLAAACALGYSLVSVLFLASSEDSLLWGVLAFLVVGFLAVYASACRPLPLTKMWAGFSIVGRFFGAAGNSLLAVAFLCMMLMLGGCAHGHVPPYDDLPVFAHRSQYLLQGGAAGYFEVPRVRYLLSAAGFQLGWHFGALGATFLLQRSLYCGTCRKDRHESSEG